MTLGCLHPDLYPYPSKLTLDPWRVDKPLHITSRYKYNEKLQSEVPVRGNKKCQWDFFVDMELFEDCGQQVKVVLVVCFWCAHWKDLLHAAPVEQESERSPAACCSDKLRWYTSKEKFNSTAYAETMAKNMCKHGQWPNVHTEIEKFMLEKNLRLVRSSHICEEGGRLLNGWINWETVRAVKWAHHWWAGGVWQSPIHNGPADSAELSWIWLWKWLGWDSKISHAPSVGQPTSAGVYGAHALCSCIAPIGFVGES